MTMQPSKGEAAENRTLYDLNRSLLDEKTKHSPLNAAEKCSISMQERACKECDPYKIKPKNESSQLNVQSFH